MRTYYYYHRSNWISSKDWSWHIWHAFDIEIYVRTECWMGSFSVFMFVFLLSTNMTNVSGHINYEFACSPARLYGWSDWNKKNHRGSILTISQYQLVLLHSLIINFTISIILQTNHVGFLFINVSLFRVCSWRVRSSILYSNLIDGGIKMGCSAVSLLCVACLPKSPSIIYLFIIRRNDRLRCDSCASSSTHLRSAECGQ